MNIVAVYSDTKFLRAKNALVDTRGLALLQKHVGGSSRTSSLAFSFLLASPSFVAPRPERGLWGLSIAKRSTLWTWGGTYRPVLQGRPPVTKFGRARTHAQPLTVHRPMWPVGAVLCARVAYRMFARQRSSTTLLSRASSACHGNPNLLLCAPPGYCATSRSALVQGGYNGWSNDMRNVLAMHAWTLPIPKTWTGIRSIRTRRSDRLQHALSPMRCIFTIDRHQPRVSQKQTPAGMDAHICSASAHPTGTLGVAVLRTRTDTRAICTRRSPTGCSSEPGVMH